MAGRNLTLVPARRGVYPAERAAQLSGVPQRTVYHWARVSRLVVPSISPERIKLWSYRDLILLRFVAWLRSRRVPILDVRQVLDAIKDSPIDLGLRVANRRVFVPVPGSESPDTIRDLLSNQSALAEGLAFMLPEFQLEASEVEELGPQKLWGPDLIRPSESIRIHPDVLGGEPFVENTRVPTSALFSLTRRYLPEHRIAELYELDVDVVKEALWLESSMRAGRKLPLAA